MAHLVLTLMFLSVVLIFYSGFMGFVVDGKITSAFLQENDRSPLGNGAGTDVLSVSPEVLFVLGNHTYKANHTMNFTNVTISSDYIAFNGTCFQATSDNNITVKVVYVHPNITGAGDGDEVLHFYANTTGGNVWFDFYLFPYNTNYTVNMSGSFLANVTANSSNYLSFNNSAWSEKEFEVFQSGSVTETTTTTTTTSTSTTTSTTTTSTTLSGGGGGGGGGIVPTTTATTTTSTTSTSTTAPRAGEIQEDSEKIMPSIIPATQEQLSRQIQLELYLSLVAFIIIVGSIAFWKRYVLFGPPQNPVGIARILADPERYLGKKVTVEGKITFVQTLKEQKMFLYSINDSSGRIYGISRKAGYEGEGTLEGFLRKGKTGLYIEF